MSGFTSTRSIRDLQIVRSGALGRLVVVLAALLLLVGAAGGSAMALPPAVAEIEVLENDATITIGVAADLSGPAEMIGWRQTNAVQLAVNQANAAGGVDIGGVAYSLALVVADSAGDAAQSIAAANSVLEAGAVAVVGHTRSSATQSAQGVYDAAGVAMVSPSASARELTEQGYDTTFRVCPKDGAEAVLMATYFRQSLGMDVVALVEWNDFEWLTDVFSSTFTSLGGTITSRRAVASTDDYAATLAAIQLENPDAVFYADPDAGNAGLLSSVAHTLGLNVIGWPNVWGDEAALDNYATAAGAAAEGDYAGLIGRRTADMPGYSQFNAAYQAAGFSSYGDDAGLYAAYAYDAAKIIIAAIDHADSADPTDIRDAIAATAHHQGVVGVYTGFDAQGDAIPQWAWLERYESGQWTMVYPYSIFLPLACDGLQ